MSRTDNTIKNIVTGIGGQFLVILTQFLCRTVFIKELSAEYLGLNGLFSNILSILSLSEMGFGTAILYSLYQPIEQNDRNKIIALLQFYKKIYCVIAVAILVFGSSLTPFIEHFIKDVPSIAHLKLIYFLYLLNTVLSYVCTYKRSILEADQKGYIINTYQKGISIIQNMVQLSVLLITHNYFAYLIVWLAATLGTNLAISHKADKNYTYINTREKIDLEKKELDNIKKNTYALFLHRIGGVVVNSTDNIIISVYVGLVQVGLYSNYTLITSNLQTLVNIVFNSATASIGNLGVTSSEEHLKDVFNRLFWGTYCIYGFCSAVLFSMFNPFIKVWCGEDYCLPVFTVFLIVLNFYLNGTRVLMRIFRDAFGLFWYFRYKSIVEALVNLVVSLTMAQFWGIDGVLVGTTLSTLAVAFWVEPYVLYKYVFGKMTAEYFVKYFIYFFQIFCIGTISYVVIDLLPDTFRWFVVKGMISVLIFLLLFLFINKKNSNLKYFWSVFKSKIH